MAKYAEESVVVEPNGEDIGAIQDACRRTGVAINLGISERVANGHTLFNSQVVIDTDGTEEHTIKQVNDLFDDLKWLAEARPQ